MQPILRLSEPLALPSNGCVVCLSARSWRVFLEGDHNANVMQGSILVVVVIVPDNTTQKLQEKIAGGRGRGK